MRLINCILVVLSVGALAQDKSQKPIDYDSYCGLPDPGAKKQAWLATTADNRSVLVRTQLERWRDANLARLDDTQKAAVAGLIESITAYTYTDGPQGELARKKSQQADALMHKLFVRDDLAAMQPDAPCIAKR